MVQITKDRINVHVNHLGDPCYHRADYRANRITNPGAPKDVNKYIYGFKADDILEGKRYFVMDDVVTGLNEKCIERAWKARWIHSGGYGHITLALQPADTSLVR